MRVYLVCVCLGRGLGHFLYLSHQPHPLLWCPLRPLGCVGWAVCRQRQGAGAHVQRDQAHPQAAGQGHVRHVLPGRSLRAHRREYVPSPAPSPSQPGLVAILGRALPTAVYCRFLRRVWCAVDLDLMLAPLLPLSCPHPPSFSPSEHPVPSCLVFPGGDHDPHGSDRASDLVSAQPRGVHSIHAPSQPHTHPPPKSRVMNTVHLCMCVDGASLHAFSRGRRLLCRYIRRLVNNSAAHLPGLR
jgi:hypothetical protein